MEHKANPKRIEISIGFHQIGTRSSGNRSEFCVDTNHETCYIDELRDTYANTHQTTIETFHKVIKGTELEALFDFDRDFGNTILDDGEDEEYGRDDRALVDKVFKEYVILCKENPEILHRGNEEYELLCFLRYWIHWAIEIYKLPVIVWETW